MWHQLQIIGAKIDKWQFVAEYDDLPTTSGVLGRASSLESAKPSRFKPKPSPTRTRA
jgi:hypothetical protein